MARRLSTLAKEINKLPGFEAKIEEGYCNTDRKVQGSRLRWPGKGRYGNRLIVTFEGEEVLDHNAAETYRCNEEVESWLRRVLKGEKPWKMF